MELRIDLFMMLEIIALGSIFKTTNLTINNPKSILCLINDKWSYSNV